MSWFGGIYQDPRNFFAQFAVDPESYLRLYPEIVLSDAEREAWLRNRTGAIVGRVTADRFRLGGRRPDPAPGHDLPHAQRPDLGVHHRRHLRGGRGGLRHVDDALPPRVPDGGERPGRAVRRPVRHPRRRSGAIGRRGGGHRHPLRQLAGRDEDLDRAGVPAGLRRPDRQRRRHGDRHPRRGLLHDPRHHGQHDGAVDPRADERAGRAQDARLHRPPGAGAGAESNRSRWPSSAGRPGSASARCWSASAIRPAAS